MSDYRIICTRKVAAPGGTHVHIEEVGTGVTPETYTRIWARADVVRAIETGADRFHTISQSTGARAEVHTADCPGQNCRLRIIRSAPDAVTDNNLDQLGYCNY